MSNVHTHASRNTRALTAAKEAAAVAAFLATKGVTKCPTAFVLPTQTDLPEEDREALQRYAEMLEERRVAKELAKAH
jgi:hypothetical protein